MYTSTYQRLYLTSKYGQAEFDRCPGVRLLPKYENWLLSPVIDLGCGTGDTVRAIREKGFTCMGVDQVDIGNDMVVADITRPLPMDLAKSAICIDVFEHLTDDRVEDILKNMKRVTRQVISVNNADSFEDNVSINLHINKKSFHDWDEFIRKHLLIVKTAMIHDNQKLYLCERKIHDA